MAPSVRRIVPRLLRRSRHLGHPALARRHATRPRSSRSAPTWPGGGARRRSTPRRAPPARSKCVVDDLREEFVRDFVFPMFRAGAIYEGQLPARHVDRAAADRQAPGRDRARGGRRRRRPRRHRQGQRPGALRAHVRRAGARADRHRAVARMGLQGTRRPDRLRRARSAFPITVTAREALLERPQPAARELRGRHPRGPVARAVRRHVPAHGGARGRRPTAPRTIEIELEAGVPVAVERRAPVAGGAARRA